MKNYEHNERLSRGHFIFEGFSCNIPIEMYPIFFIYTILLPRVKYFAFLKYTYFLYFLE